MTKLPPEFWLCDPVPPSPFLANLREAVLDRTDKRCPKWRFVFAPDLVIQVQPRPVSLISDAAKARGYRQWLLRFDCVAVQGGDITRGDFERWSHGRNDRMQVKFVVFAEEGAADWLFKPTNIRWSRGLDAAAFDLRHRVLSALRSGFLNQLNAEMMFQPTCLCCGKGLTDPASMARWIGPECAGTSSLAAGIGNIIANQRLQAA